MEKWKILFCTGIVKGSDEMADQAPIMAKYFWLKTESKTTKNNE